MSVSPVPVVVSLEVKQKSRKASNRVGNIHPRERYQRTEPLFLCRGDEEIRIPFGAALPFLLPLEEITKMIFISTPKHL